jgi:hemerythrin-like domain-containing protein
MQQAALRIIRDEHAALAAVLRSIPRLLQQAHQSDRLPDFAALRAMLFYIDEFPQKRHHRKESELLFPALRLRTSQAADVLDRLDRDHAQGERAIRELEHALLAFEMMGEGRRADFERAAQNHVDFYLRHMTLEESQVLPLAERWLTAEDWATLDAAFQANRDPLAGHLPDAPYRALFTRIVNALPAPLGLGPAS